MRVNGLYGHVRNNDVRSLALFAGFLATFHLLAAMAFLVPLAMFDPEHAPLYGWSGYLVRWVPILTVAGIILFAVQMAWHVRSVRTRTAFRFVDDSEEPRLCRIVEPLAIAAGIPTPYVGVIDSPAMNAFACGIRRKDAVLVFTRGIIDGLDDDELASVAAHEIVHIVNGDIRLIAATNVCLDTLKLLQQRRNPKRVNRMWEALTLPMLAVAMPLLAVLVLVLSFLRRLAVDASHLTRLLIASAREFIADAEAARLTQNPAALVSALRRIEGRSTIPGLAAGQDAMMIDGAHEGAFATHPTIAERIAALVGVTGSVALIAPARRDTRPAELRAADDFGRRRAPMAETAVPHAPRRRAVLPRASAADGLNRLGLTREMTIGAVLAVGAFLGVHGGKPEGVAAAFDPAPMRTLFVMGGQGFSCQVQAFAWLAGVKQQAPECDEVDGLLAAHRGEGGVMGMLADQHTPGSAGLHGRGDGTFSNVRAPGAQLAEVRGNRCFQTDGYSVGEWGLHAVTEQPDPDDTISLPRWLTISETAARRVEQASPGERDAALLDYFRSRKTLGQAIHRFFGEPGLEVARAAYEGKPHRNAVAALQQRVLDPGFAPALSALERAEIEHLAEHPLDFVSCTARRREARAALSKG